MGPAGTALLVVVAASLAAPGARALSCVDDEDCKGDDLCFGGTCTSLGDDQSLLRISLAPGGPETAAVEVDGAYMGDLPWDGIIAAGDHEIRVEAPGYESKRFRGESPPKTPVYIKVTLEPDPDAAPGDETAAEEGEEGPEEAGDLSRRFCAGIFLGGAYGTAAWGDSKMRPGGSLQGGISLGAYLIDDPMRIELGIAASSTSLYIEDWSDWGEFVKLHFGLVLRFMFEVTDIFYMGVELEAGYAVSYLHYIYADLRGAMSVFPLDWLEVRLNVLGVEYIQEVHGDGYIAAYDATLGLVAWFP